MRHAEALAAQVGERQRELRELLDEYAEVQQRLQTLEAATGCAGDRAAENVVADLPHRLRRVAEAADVEIDAVGKDDDDPTPTDEPGEAAEYHGATRDDATTCASQAEVAAAVERVEEADDDDDGDDPNRTEDEPSEDGGLDDIIIG